MKKMTDNTNQNPKSEYEQFCDERDNILTELVKKLPCDAVTIIEDNPTLNRIENRIKNLLFRILHDVPRNQQSFDYIIAQLEEMLDIIESENTLDFRPSNLR